jgi:hypothetical protein
MLSFLGLGAVAGTAVGSRGFDSPIPSTQDSYWIDKKSYVDATPMVKDTSGYIKEMQEQLSAITSDPAKWIAQRVTDEMKDWRMGFSSVKFSEIDPDIRNMKSVTETTKMRMYFERRATRQAEVNQTSLTHRIAEYLGVSNVLS